MSIFQMHDAIVNIQNPVIVSHHKNRAALLFS